MNKAGQQKPQELNIQRGFIGKLINGDFGLAMTFWVYGVLVNLLFSAIDRFIPLPPIIALIIGLIGVGFLILVIIGIFRAADKYKGGSHSLPNLAKFFASLWGIRLVIELVAAFSALG
jgi:hypothetical protein